jgi:prepilin-type N-terminal cleavage/methylation domain-containing protein
MPQTRDIGFTLIELSIVLVIIGLITGTILTGRDMIHAAEIRATLKQVENFDSASNTFIAKYNCLPGDCAYANDLGFPNYLGASGNAANGDGNGRISTANNESANAFSHLSGAQLLSLDNTPAGSAPLVAPKMPAGNDEGSTGGWSIGYIGGSIDPVGSPSLTSQPGHYYWLQGYFNVGYPVVLPIDAYALDSKIDDGLPLSGRMRATGHDGLGEDTEGNLLPIFNNDWGTPGAADDVCETNAMPSQYNVLNISYHTLAQCTVVIKASGF